MRVLDSMRLVRLHGLFFDTFFSVDKKHLDVRSANLFEPHLFKGNPDSIIEPGPGKGYHLFRPWLIGGRTVSGKHHHRYIYQIATYLLHKVFLRNNTDKGFDLPSLRPCGKRNAEYKHCCNNRHHFDTAVFHTTAPKRI